jgi:hypothetical protein
MPLAKALATVEDCFTEAAGLKAAADPARAATRRSFMVEIRWLFNAEKDGAYCILLLEIG